MTKVGYKKKYKNRQWTNKKIANVGVLIAVSVVFVLIGSMLFAITSFPSFKVAFGGLPVKLTGYIFGPIIGGITGAIADILSFIYLPTYYHFAYTIVMAMAGIIPGLIMKLFSKFKHKKISPRVLFYSLILFLLTIASAIVLLIEFIPQETVDKIRFPIHSKLILELIVTSGLMFIFLMSIVLWFFMKRENFINIVPIIIAVVLMEIMNDLITPWGDNSTLDVPYISAALAHILLSPIKMVFNVAVLYIAWRVVYPLIKTRQDNSYRG